MNRRLQVAILSVAAVALAGGGFVAGTTVGPGISRSGAATPSAAPDAGARAGAGGGVAAGFGGARVVGGAGGAQAQVAGRVLSVGDGSITIEARQPGGDQARSVIALVGGNARVVRTTETEIKASDIKPGDQVIVVGQPDQTTGAISANAVIVGLTAIGQLFGGGQAAPSGAPRRASPSPTR